MLRRLAVVALLAAVAPAQKAPQGTILEGDLGHRLDMLVLEKAPSFWGAILVAADGKPVLAKGYGYADRQKVQNGPLTLFDLGGATQQLTTIAALRLVADKKLRLQDPVSKLLADWPADKAAITIDDLLLHKSGLPGEASWSKGGANASRTAIQAIAGTPLANRPGAKVAYSGVNASLLALVLEEVLQQRFDKLVVDRVCKPFGMTTAVPCTSRPDSKLVSLRRSPQNERGEPATAFDLNWAHRGARGMLASVYDVHALLRGLTAGELLDKQHLDLLWRPIVGGAYDVVEAPGNGEALVCVGGQATGYRARWIVQRSTRSWVVLLTEDYGSIDDLQAALVAELGQLRPAAAVASGDGKNPTAPAPSEQAPSAGWSATEYARFHGTFVLPRGGGFFVVERDGEGLRLWGLGLQGSVRVAEGAWPPAAEERLRAMQDRALRLVERLVADEAAVDAEGFADAPSGAAAREILRTFRKQHPDGAIDYVGTTLAGAGESWFRLEGSSPDALHVVWADASRWRRCELAPMPAAFSVPLEWVRPDVAAAKTASGRNLVLTIEGEGSERRLVFEDESPGREGLFECELRR